LLRCPLRPFALESGTGGGYGLVNVFLGSYLYAIGYKALIVWVVDGESFARCGIDVLDNNQVGSSMSSERLTSLLMKSCLCTIVVVVAVNRVKSRREG
jgi:hypothetical protein